MNEFRSRIKVWLLIGLLAGATAGMGILSLNRSHWPALVACGFTAGSIVVGLWRMDCISTRQVLGVAVLLRLTLIWLPPTLSDDVYRYLWDGLLQTEGINPYQFVPADDALEELHSEWIFDQLNSTGYYSVYPPFSQFLFLVAGLFYAYGWQVNYYILKLLFSGMELGGVIALSRLSTSRGLMLYAWHPLVVMIAGGQVHTEAVLVLLMSLSVLLIRRGRGGHAGMVLAGAGLTKLYPFVLAPLLLRRFGWGAIGVMSLVTVILGVPYAASYVFPHVWSSLDLYVRSFEFNASLYYLAKETYRLATGLDGSKTLGPALRTVFLASLPLIYLLDWRFKWPFERSAFWILGLFFLLSTTVHPWYLLGILPFVSLHDQPAWHWFWLGLCSLGTYLHYVPGWEPAYWAFVVAGWGGWLFLAWLKHADAMLQGLLRWRAKSKVRFILPFIPPHRKLRILDLGAGEGYVGEELARSIEAEVVLTDIIPLNRTSLPHVLYDGYVLPFAVDAYDITVLYFVLHHARDPGQVLVEAMRVTRERIILVESIYSKPWEHKLLRFLDLLANRIRSDELMNAQEEHLYFKTESEWLTFFNNLGITVSVTRRKGNLVHKQILFVLDAGFDSRYGK